MHGFIDLLEFAKWHNKKYTKLYIESTEPKTAQKRFISQLKKLKSGFFYLNWGKYPETGRAFQLQGSSVRKICKVVSSEKSERHWVQKFKERTNLAFREQTSLCQKLPSQLERKTPLLYC